MSDDPGAGMLDFAQSVFVFPCYLQDGQERVGEWRVVAKALAESPWQEDAGPAVALAGHPRATEYFDEQALKAYGRSYAGEAVVVSADWLSGRWRIMPRLSLFKTGFLVLSLHAEPVADDGAARQVPLAELLRFNERFRSLDLKQYQRSGVSHAFQAVGGQKLQTAGNLLRHLCTGVTTVEPALPGFDRMITCTMAGGPLIADDLFFRLATVDELASPLPSAEYLSLRQGAVEYTRWKPNHRIAFTGYSMAWHMNTDPAVHSLMFQEDARTIHFPVLYAGIMADLIAHQVGALAVYSREQADLRPMDRSYRARMPGLQREIMTFINSVWFGRVSYEVQGHEMYQAWRKAAGLPELYEEVTAEVRASYDHLRAEQDRAQSRLLSRLQWVFGGFALAGLFLSGVPGAMGIATPRLTSPWLPWSISGGLAAIGVVTALAQHLLDRRRS